MRACGQKLVKFCTLTHAAKLVVRLAPCQRLRAIVFELPAFMRRRYFNLCVPPSSRTMLAFGGKRHLLE